MTWLWLLLIPAVVAFITANTWLDSYDRHPVQRGGAHPRAIKREPNGGYEGLPVWWAKPYGDPKACWGCGGDPTCKVEDLQYGWDQGKRPMCDTCIQIIEPILRALPRPPAQLSAHKNPIRIQNNLWYEAQMLRTQLILQQWTKR